jgi:hypothetical protein
MNSVYERCAGIDVHKRSVVVCAITPDRASAAAQAAGHL